MEADDIAGKTHFRRNPEGHSRIGNGTVRRRILRPSALHEGLQTGPSPACADENQAGLTAVFIEKFLYILIKFDSFLCHVFIFPDRHDNRSSSMAPTSA